MMNMKGGTGFLFTAEISNLGNRSCAVLRIVLNEYTAQHCHDRNQVVCVDLLPTIVWYKYECFA